LDTGKQKILSILETVTDPEVPVLSIMDLGIVRDISIDENNVEVFITPTYSGCPAMDMIAMNIRMELLQHGFENIKITEQLSPAWTTDWMTETGKEKLKAYGIAPPVGKAIDQQFLEALKVECPQCHSKNTKAPKRIWFYGMQSFIPVPGLQRAVRLFQMSLTSTKFIFNYVHSF
jgi:ring-1,2-phenylacetyl-CoA epoxidase subunit PaaD